jgi:hypothetical protein
MSQPKHNNLVVLQQTAREEERRAEAEDLGAEVEEPLFLPTPALMASAEEE